MKKEEKTKYTCEKILQAALIEFGTQSYESVSLNSICKKYQISKGLIYHNFENKDSLYLSCVNACFRNLTAYLKSHEQKSETIQTGIKHFLETRQDFFKKNPMYRYIFFNVLLYPASHLEKEIKEITQEYDTYVRTCYQNLLSETPLRAGITLDTAVEYLCIFQDIYNGYYQQRAYRSGNFEALIEEHEVKIAKLLEIVLYGLSSEN